MISPAQIRLLKTAQRDRAIDDDTWRDLLEREIGVRSTSDIATNADVDKMLKVLERLGFHNSARRSRRPQPNAAIQPRQRDLILALATEIGWTSSDGQVNTERVRGFARKVCSNADLLWPQTRAQANKVIEGLKAIKRKQNDAQNG